MARGGKRDGAGRKPGSVTKLDREVRERVIASGDETPLDFLLRIMRTSEDENRQLDAAKAAAPYVHAKLASIEVGNKDDKPFAHVGRIELVAVTPDERDSSAQDPG